MDKGNKSGTGRKLEWLLVSEDSTEYCPGVYKKAGKEPQATKEFNEMKKSMTAGSIWKVSKVAQERHQQERV